MPLVHRSDIDSWLAVVKDGGLLPESVFRTLCNKLKEILVEESNVQPVSAPVIIATGFKGHFWDLLKLFDTGGWPPNQSYIFLGNYTCRGYHSCEALQLLMCFKLKWPDKVTLLRGHQDEDHIMQFFGFKDDVQRKYGNLNVYKDALELMDYIGITASIEGKILCVNGGPDPDATTLDQI